MEKVRRHDQGSAIELMPLLALSGWIFTLAACYAALVRIHDLRAAPQRSIIILLIAGFVYALACLWLHRRWSGWSRRTRRHALVVIVLGSIVFRLLLLGVPPSLSDDVYRYRWDGRVQAAGLNPYAEPPGSTTLAELRDPLWLRINYPTIRTIYGPLAEWMFAVAYFAGGQLRSFQLLAVFGDLVVIGLLLLCLARWKLPAWQVALYAWCPLAAMESASNSHFDAWPAAAVLLAVYAVSIGAATLTTAALTAGILMKTWPLVFVPLSVRRHARWQVPLMATLIVAAYLPYRGAGLGLLQPWTEYTGRWLFNDAGFFVLRTLTGSQDLAKGIAAAIGIGVLGALWRRRTDAVRGSYWLLTLAIFLMPAIHPWYLLWALPLAAAALDMGWITAAVLAPLSYWILVGAGPDSNTWVEPSWVRFAIWLPAVAAWTAQTLIQGPPAPPAPTPRLASAENPVR